MAKWLVVGMVDETEVVEGATAGAADEEAAREGLPVDWVALSPEDLETPGARRVPNRGRREVPVACAL